MKYFIYARKSTDEEDRQVLSIDSQVNELKEFAAKEKLEIAASLCEAKTAKEPGRLIFNQLLKRIENNKKTKIEKLQSFVCAESVEEARKIASLEPTAIAIEPPELIGSGRSVTTARAEIVIDGLNAVKAINPKIIFLCGAGVSNKSDAKKALG
jgi:hypothetical protein